MTHKSIRKYHNQQLALDCALFFLLGVCGWIGWWAVFIVGKGY